MTSATGDGPLISEAGGSERGARPLEEHERWMRVALTMAEKAESTGEVPVGAVLVGPQGEIARGHNAPLGRHDPTAHAEVNVLREAGRKLGNYRLPGTTLYVTVEPCTMCAGALIHARIETVVFGTREPKTGALVSRLQSDGSGILEGLNHRLAIVEGVLESECALQLKRFFTARRTRSSAPPD